MSEYESALKFENYIVNQVIFKVNDKYKEPENGVSIKMDITPKVQSKKEKMDVTLFCDIFTDAEKNNYPFEMSICLTGIFSTEGEKAEVFIKNAIAILFPYLRAIVSTYTASANVPPLILPAINVNKLIENTKSKD